ncbi:MAG TPA: hypothetical protein VNR65_09845, partial [Geobacterales bacterium]|nr:hypothetical protein [Geobacterales bacterium]
TSRTDPEQRDRARDIYEENIRQSSIHSSKAIWQSVRDRRSEAIEWESGCIRDPTNNATTR